MKRIGMLLVVSSVAIAGCKKEEAPAAGGEKAAEKPAERPAEKPAEKPTVAPVFLPVPALGVQLEVPGDARAEQGAGDSYMVMSDSAPDCVVMLAKETPDMAEKYDRVVARIKEGKMGHGTLKTMSKEEQGPDGGWKLEWQSESNIEPGQVRYGVDYRIMIDGAIYGCARKTSTPEGQACVARACASVKKL